MARVSVFGTEGWRFESFRMLFGFMMVIYIYICNNTSFTALTLYTFLSNNTDQPCRSHTFSLFINMTHVQLAPASLNSYLSDDEQVIETIHNTPIYSLLTPNKSMEMVRKA